MKRLEKDNIQKFSLRKYKGIGAASVLLGMLYLGASPVLAEEDSTATAKEEAVSDSTDKIEMETLSNAAGSYTMPKMHVFSGLGNKYISGYDSNTKKYYTFFYTGEQKAYDDFKYVENRTSKKQGSDSFKDTKVSYVTKKDEQIKATTDLENAVVNEKNPGTSMDYKIRGLFGKRYEGKIHSLTNTDLDKLKESDKIIKTTEGTYHKIDTVVEKGEGTSKETKFNNVTVHANPINLHNEDGSIRYENIKDGARVWLVSETSENHYDKYVLATKPTGANDTWARDTFKKAESKAKVFTKENVSDDGGIKEGDTILIVEKNEVALTDSYSTATEQKAYTDGAYYNEKALESGLADLFETRANELKHESEASMEKPKTWEEIYKIKLLNKAKVDDKKRPIYSETQSFHGYIREKDGFKEYNDIEKYITVLKKKFGDTEIRTGWNETRDIIEPKFNGNMDEYKDTVNYQREKEYVTRFTEAHKNIQYVEKIPTDANFVKNVFEVNVWFKYGDRDRDLNYPREEEDNSESIEKKYLAYVAGSGNDGFYSQDYKYQYNLGQLYKEYEKEGITYRVATVTKYDQYAFVSQPIYTTIEYYDLYLPTRAYHISDKLTNIKNIYAKEEKAITENKGNVKVHYQLEDGTIIKESADVVKDAVISSTEEKYYLDRNNQKVAVGEPKTTFKDVSYDASALKLQEIIKDGKKYKLVGLKTGSPAEIGKVVSGITEITYVYKLASAGNVFEKYMIEGTNTEIAMEKQLTNESSIGVAYTSTPPEAYTVIKKAGKTYIYKGHRATSAPESGTVDETTKTVIYDFVELIAEKGEPDKQDNLPEAVISIKGDSTIHEIDKLIVTRYITKDEGFDIIPPIKGKIEPEWNFVDKNGRHYKYIETKEYDGIITHYYKQIISNGHIKVIETTKQEDLRNTEKSINPNILPNTGNNSTETIGLGVLSLLGAGIVRRKKGNKENI